MIVAVKFENGNGIEINFLHLLIDRHNFNVPYFRGVFEFFSMQLVDMPLPMRPRSLFSSDSQNSDEFVDYSAIVSVN